MLCNKRIHQDFKILYVFGILFIVFGHLGGTLGILTELFPFHSFHVALFVFASGYFYKKPKRLASFFGHNFLRLLLPLLAWNAFFGVLAAFTHLFGMTIGGTLSFYNLILDPFLYGNAFGFSPASWFVVPFFCTKAFHAALDSCIRTKREGIKKCALCIFYLCLGVLGAYLSDLGYNRGGMLFWLRIFHFLPFFAFGMLYRSIEPFLSLPVFFRLGLTLLLQTGIWLLKGKIPVFDQTLSAGFQGEYVLPFLLGVNGTLFWLNVSKLLAQTLSLKPISFLADHTYDVMMLHQLGFFALKLLFFLGYKIGICPAFDSYAFKTNVWYVYLPLGFEPFLLLYLLAGVLLPLLFSLFKERFKKFFYNIT